MYRLVETITIPRKSISLNNEEIKNITDIIPDFFTYEPEESNDEDCGHKRFENGSELNWIWAYNSIVRYCEKYSTFKLVIPKEYIFCEITPNVIEWAVFNITQYVISKLNLTEPLNYHEDVPYSVSFRGIEEHLDMINFVKSEIKKGNRVFIFL